MIDLTRNDPIVSPLRILRCRGHHTQHGVLFNFIAIYPSDERPRLNASRVAKKPREKRRLDNSVADTSKIHSFFVTTTAAEQAPRGPVVQGLDLTLYNSTDRALFHLGTLPSELISAILHHGPCRPKGPFAISSENGNRRIFSETHCHAHYGAMETERQWLCFSPMTKKPSRQSCWLLGDPSAMQKEWDNSVSGKLKNFGVKIKSILHDVGELYHPCPSMLRYYLIMFVFIPNH